MFGSVPDVVIPRMHSELTSRRVLVMEWVEVRPSISPINSVRGARIVMNYYYMFRIVFELEILFPDT